MEGEPVGERAEFDRDRRTAVLDSRPEEVLEELLDPVGVGDDRAFDGRGVALGGPGSMVEDYECSTFTFRAGAKKA